MVFVIIILKFRQKDEYDEYEDEEESEDKPAPPKKKVKRKITKKSITKKIVRKAAPKTSTEEPEVNCWGLKKLDFIFFSYFDILLQNKSTLCPWFFKYTA